MTLRIGCDIVSINQFENRLNVSGELLPERIFHPSERIGANAETLAGIFAAKEAVLKALNMPPGAWWEIRIGHEKSGAPTVDFLEPHPGIKEIRLSISHNGDYAIAFVAAVIE